MTVSSAQPTFSVLELANRIADQHAADAAELRAWLVDFGLARPAGGLRFELTERGVEAAAGVEQLIAWIRD